MSDSNHTHCNCTNKQYTVAYDQNGQMVCIYAPSIPHAVYQILNKQLVEDPFD